MCCRCIGTRTGPHPWEGGGGGGLPSHVPSRSNQYRLFFPSAFFFFFFFSPPLVECPDVNINTERKRNGDHDVCVFSSSLANRCGLVVRWALASLYSVGVMVALRNKAGDE